MPTHFRVFTMKKHFSVGGFWLAGLLLVALAATVLYAPQILPVPPAGAQNVSPNLTGWAWSSNIGWISFNCLNTNSCASGSYGVELEDDANGIRYLKGYAWNNSIGWIQFDPASGFPSGQNTEAKPSLLRTSDDRVVGWARACNVFADGCSGPLKSATDLGGWDGWISLGRTDSVKGTNNQNNNPYGVSVTETVVGNRTDLVFDQFAWGGDVLGWIDFGPGASVDGVVCIGCGQPVTHTLTVSKTGDGVGTITSSPAGVNCGSDCAETYNADTVVTLEYSTDDSFGGWTGCDVADDFDSNGTEDCRVTMSADKAVTADFDQTGGPGPANNNTLTIRMTGTGTGQVRLPIADMLLCDKNSSAEKTCNWQYGSSIGVLPVESGAITASGGSFTGWAGCSAGSAGNNCNYNISNNNQTVTADYGTDGTPVDPCDANPNLPECDNGNNPDPDPDPCDTNPNGPGCGNPTNPVCPGPDCVEVSCLKPMALVGSPIIVSDKNTPTITSPKVGIKLAGENSFVGQVTITAENLPSAGNANTVAQFDPSNVVNSIGGTYPLIPQTQFSVFFPDTELDQFLRSAFADGGDNGQYTINLKASVSDARCIEQATPESRTVILRYTDSDVNPQSAGN